jgi:hypothetical protein
MAVATGDDFAAELRGCGEKLPRELHDSIVARGSALVPALLEILNEDECDDDSPDVGSRHVGGRAGFP